jgi:tetratricopeptide (TPR) repeat protein
MYSFQRQLWSDCITEFTKLIWINPENSEYYIYRGRSNASLSFYNEALEDLTRAIRLDPDSPDAFFHRGCLLREQYPHRAIQDLTISLLLEDGPQSADAYFHRGT